MGKAARIAGLIHLLASALFCGLGVSYFLGYGGLIIGSLAFIASTYAVAATAGGNPLEALTYRPVLWTLLRTSFYYGALLTGHFGLLGASRFGPAATVGLLVVFSVFVLHRIVMPSFLAIPATDLFV